MSTLSCSWLTRDSLSSTSCSQFTFADMRSRSLGYLPHKNVVSEFHYAVFGLCHGCWHFPDELPGRIRNCVGGLLSIFPFSSINFHYQRYQQCSVPAAVLPTTHAEQVKREERERERRRACIIILIHKPFYLPFSLSNHPSPRHQSRARSSFSFQHLPISAEYIYVRFLCISRGVVLPIA